LARQPEERVVIIAAHQTMMAPPALPYDAEVEYVGCSGAQYVDTGIVPNSTTGIDMELLFTIPDPSSTINTFCSGGNGWNNNEFLIVANNGAYDGAGRLYYNHSAGSYSVYLQNVSKYAGERHRYAILSGACYFDTTRVGTYTNRNLSTTSSVYLCAAHRSGVVVEPLYGRLYCAKLYHGGALARDYIPVRVGSGSSAAGYLYDRVSGTLFGNAGTGNFTIGPDKT
jgi:hypothetical protein